ncbi:class II aldolase/adducin family protein [Pseudophaeobacter sp.]|uniref:class II aldolase/adducin family protein n=1 Tax=Pseudophaeobacter sp. TaxID=1971739 RepID=UPI0032981D9B
MSAQVLPRTELEARQQLSALYRLCHLYGWTDLTSTHISTRIPGRDDAYLMNAHDELFDEITASSLCEIGFDGQMRTPGRVLNQAGHEIHSAVLKARPEVNFVLHSHTRAGVAVSAMPQGLLPISQHSGFVLGTLATHPFQDSTVVADEGVALAADLGANYTMLLQNHGLLAVGRTAAEVFMYHYHLEASCKILADVLGAVQNPILIPDAALDPLLAWGAPENGPHGGHIWPALLRRLEREQPGYDQ